MGSANIFQYLKPVCVPLVKNPSLENFRCNLAKVEHLDHGSIQDKALLEYAIFPFKLAFQNVQLKEKEEILCFQCIGKIFSKCKEHVFQTDTILWVFNVFSIYFTPKEMLTSKTSLDEAVSHKIEKSEEQKMAVLDMLSNLLNFVNDDNLEKSYDSDKNLPLIGHVFSIILKLFDHEKSKDIQLKSIACLKLLCGSRVKPKYSRTFADCISSFFPGIALTFNTFLTSSVNQTTKLLIAALETFSFVICLVLNDDSYPAKTKVSIDEIKSLMKVKDKDKNDESQEPDIKAIQVKRDKSWFEKTSSHTETVIRNFLPVVMTQDHVKTRLAVIDFVDNTLKCCMVSLKSSVPDLLDALAKFLCDSYNEVKERSISVLENTTAVFQTKGDTRLTCILQERLYNLFLSLPRIMNSANDRIKLAHLYIIKGYLVMFGKNFEEFLYSSSHLKIFFASLLQVLEFETQSISLVEEKTQISRLAIVFSANESEAQISFYNKHFRYFHDTDILGTIQEIIRMIVLNGDIEIILDHLLNESINNVTLRLQTVFTINEVIKACQDTDMDAAIYVDQITSTFLQEHLWKVAITNDHLMYAEERNPSQDLYSMTESDTALSGYSDLVIPFESLNSNIQLICLFLEGFTIHACAMKTNYTILLIQTLYPILEKVGSVNATISRTALQALTDIATHCQYESVSDLIMLNSDYLVNAVTLQFRHLVHGSAAPAVLSVVLRLCDKNIIPIVCDAMEDVFTNLDEYQEDVAEMMLNVLKYFAIAVDKWCNNEEDDNNDAGSKTLDNVNKMSSIDVNNVDVSIGHFVKEYSQLSSRAHGFIDSDDDVTLETDHDEGNACADEPIQEESSSEKKDDVPAHFKVILKAMERCRYYNAANDNNIRLKSLEVTYYCVVALRKRENDLLPTLHKVWPSVVARLKENHQVIILKCLTVVSCMVKYSADFLRKRLATEFLPAAIRFLKDHQSSFSRNKSKYLQMYKVLDRLISFLGEVVGELDIGLKDFCEVATVCSAYLNCQLHESVQKTTMATMKKLSEIQPEAVWLLLNSLSTSNPQEPPHPMFGRITLPENAMKRNVYTDNVMNILV